MKLLTGLALLTLTMNTAFAAKPKPLTFTQAVGQMKLGTFKGKTDNNKNCTAILRFEKDADGAGFVTGTINYLNYSNQPATTTIVIHSKKEEELSFRNDGDEEYRTAALTKSKSIPEPDYEEYEVSLIETIHQTIENGKLTEMRLENYAVNEHSDPHEDVLGCNIP